MDFKLGNTYCKSESPTFHVTTRSTLPCAPPLAPARTTVRASPSNLDTSISINSTAFYDATVDHSVLCHLRVIPGGWVRAQSRGFHTVSRFLKLSVFLSFKKTGILGKEAFLLSPGSSRATWRALLLRDGRDDEPLTCEHVTRRIAGGPEGVSSLL